MKNNNLYGKVEAFLQENLEANIDDEINKIRKIFKGQLIDDVVAELNKIKTSGAIDNSLAKKIDAIFISISFFEHSIDNNDDNLKSFNGMKEDYISYYKEYIDSLKNNESEIGSEKWYISQLNKLYNDIEKYNTNGDERSFLTSYIDYKEMISVYLSRYGKNEILDNSIINMNRIEIERAQSILSKKYHLKYENEILVDVFDKVDEKISFKKRINELASLVKDYKNKDEKLYLKYLVEYHIACVDFFKKFDKNEQKIKFHEDKALEYDEKLLKLENVKSLKDESVKKFHADRKAMWAKIQLLKDKNLVDYLTELVNYYSFCIKFEKENRPKNSKRIDSLEEKLSNCEARLRYEKSRNSRKTSEIGSDNGSYYTALSDISVPDKEKDNFLKKIHSIWNFANHFRDNNPLMFYQSLMSYYGECLKYVQKYDLNNQRLINSLLLNYDSCEKNISNITKSSNQNLIVGYDKKSLHNNVLVKNRFSIIKKITGKKKKKASSNEYNSRRKIAQQKGENIRKVLNTRQAVDSGKKISANISEQEYSAAVEAIVNFVNQQGYLNDNNEFSQGRRK